MTTCKIIIDSSLLLLLLLLSMYCASISLCRFCHFSSLPCLRRLWAVITRILLLLLFCASLATLNFAYILHSFHRFEILREPGAYVSFSCLRFSSSFHCYWSNNNFNKAYHVCHHLTVHSDGKLYLSLSSSKYLLIHAEFIFIKHLHRQHTVTQWTAFMPSIKTSLKHSLATFIFK